MRVAIRRGSLFIIGVEVRYSKYDMRVAIHNMKCGSLFIIGVKNGSLFIIQNEGHYS